MHFNVIPKARKESSKASKDTLKKSVNVIENVRKVTAGEHDRGIQQAAEIAKLFIDKRAEVCSRAGIKRGNYISKTMCNVMKSFAGLTYYRFRKLELLFRQVGVVVESEQAMKEEIKCLVGSHFQSAMINFEFRDGDHPDSMYGMRSTTAPCVYVEHLGFLITDTLSQCHDARMLHWHPSIPKEEIWLNIGGNKGQGSFKMGFQVVNVEKPNSQSNAVIFRCF